MDCSLPGSSVHGIFQARVLEWGAIAFSTSPARAPKLQLAVEQPSARGPSKKKDTPPPKTKKLHWDSRRDTVTIKSNPIPTGRVTHRLENNDIKAVLTLLWRFWTPLQASQPGDPTKGLGIPRESGLEGWWDLVIAFRRTEGNRYSSLGRHRQSCAPTKTQRRGAVTHRRRNQKYLLVWEGLLWRCGSVGAPQGRGHWKVCLGGNPLGGHH